MSWLSLKSVRGFCPNLMLTLVSLLLPIAGFGVFNYMLCNWVTTSKISYLNIKLEDINITKQSLGSQFLTIEVKEKQLFLLQGGKKSINAYELRVPLSTISPVLPCLWTNEWIVIGSESFLLPLVTNLQNGKVVHHRLILVEVTRLSFLNIEGALYV